MSTEKAKAAPKAAAKPAAKTAPAKAPAVEFKYGVGDLADKLGITEETCRGKLRGLAIAKVGRSYGWNTKDELQAVADKLTAAKKEPKKAEAKPAAKKAEAKPAAKKAEPAKKKAV